ncbi:MAG: metallophosphoesterase family protein [Thermoguttaceae bacterium]
MTLDAAEQPQLRFVQWNDTHVSPTPSAYIKANEKLDYLIATANAGTPSLPKPDFVIGVGDIINGDNGIASLWADFAWLKPRLAGLTRRFYPVVGNHEDEGVANQEKQAPYKAMFGEGFLNYTFQAGGIQFVVLDNSGISVSPIGARRARDKWLRDTLDQSDSPVIICCHVPLTPIREEAVLKKSFGFPSYIAYDKALLNLVDSHADRIIAVLSGHLHLTGVVQRKGVYHICPSGTASYPCDFATYDVFRDRIQVRMHSVPKELLTPQTDIHGPPRWKTPYTDAKHTTHETYIRGNPNERDFEIRLDGKKRLADVDAQ